MRTTWRVAVVVFLGAMSSSSAVTSVHARAIASAIDQDLPAATADTLAATPVPPRTRGFNTAQLLDWLDSDGNPIISDSVPGVRHCPAAAADAGQTTRFGCAVAMMGVSGSRLQRLVVFWADVQPTGPSEFDAGWTKYQKVIDELAVAGVTQVIITPVGSPNWARHENRRTPNMYQTRSFALYAHPDLDQLDPNGQPVRDDWEAFVEELARRVSAVGFEIGNEENTNNFWDPIAATNEPPSPPDYATLYCSAVEGISRVKPNATIGVGGLAAIRTTNLHPTGGADKVMKSSAFLRSAVNHGVGGANCRLNFVGFHPYLTNDYCTRTPAERPIGATSGIKELKAVETFLHNTNRRQKIWITEWGFPSRPYGQCTYSAAKQAQLIALEHNYLARLPYTAFSGYFNLVDDFQPNQNGSIGLGCYHVVQQNPRLADFHVKRSFNTWRDLRPQAPGGPYATSACTP